MSFVASTPLNPVHATATTLNALVERAPSERLALTSARETLSYGELLRRSKRLAAGLARLGIGRGDVVAAQLPNGVEFVTLYLAATRLGAALQTLHMPYREAELSDLLAQSGAKVAVVLARFKDAEPAVRVLGLKSALPALRHVIAVGESATETLSLATLLRGPESIEADIAEPRDVMVLLYTSGTTANPKGVANAHAGFLTNARAAAAEFGFTPEDVVLAVAPFTHLYGLFALHLAFASRGAAALLPAFAPESFVAAVRDTGTTAIFASPAHFAAALGQNLVKAEDFARVRLICVSGSPVAPELAAAIEAAVPSAKVIQLWGMSELQAGSFGRPSDPIELRHRTAGRPSPGTEVRIVDDEGRVREQGFDGRLQVKGPSLFSGYRLNEQATAQAFTADGWFDTGDTARLTPEGAVMLTGRVKEIINRGGVKFSPIDVEAAIERMPDIARAAMVPMPDAVLGERAALFVVARDGATPSLADVAAHLDAQGVAKFKWPERLELIEEMPVTPTQKIMRGRLTEILRARQEAAS